MGLLDVRARPLTEGALEDFFLENAQASVYFACCAFCCIVARRRRACWSTLLLCQARRTPISGPSEEGATCSRSFGLPERPRCKSGSPVVAARWPDLRARRKGGSGTADLRSEWSGRGFVGCAPLPAVALEIDKRESLEIARDTAASSVFFFLYDTRVFGSAVVQTFQHRRSPRCCRAQQRADECCVRVRVRNEEEQRRAS